LSTYADSSFLSSIYVQDVHRSEVSQRMSLAPSVWISPLNRAELAHAIYQYVFRQTLSEAQANRVWNEFLDDCANGIWIPVEMPAKVWETSVHLAEKHGAVLGIRTLDSLHVACALELKAQRFWTFDDRQARLAEAVGLDTSA
jgi:predicted nucleic acid-binding protein